MTHRRQATARLGVQRMQRLYVMTEPKLSDLVARLRRLHNTLVDYEQLTFHKYQLDGPGEMLFNDTATLIESQQSRIAALEAALRELVDCKDLNLRARSISPVEPGFEREILMDEWRVRDREAWSVARNLLAGSAT